MVFLNSARKSTSVKESPSEYCHNVYYTEKLEWCVCLSDRENFFWIYDSTRFIQYTIVTDRRTDKRTDATKSYINSRCREWSSLPTVVPVLYSRAARHYSRDSVLWLLSRRSRQRERLFSALGCPSVCLLVCLSVAKMQITRFSEKLSNFELSLYWWPIGSRTWAF